MRLLCMVLTAAAFAACTPGNNATEDAAPGDGVIEATGTVRYVDLEGGFYGLVAEDGTQYDPSSLPEEYQQEGLRVRFRIEPRENVLTTRMWGQVVRLLDIERL